MKCDLSFITDSWRTRRRDAGRLVLLCCYATRRESSRNLHLSPQETTIPTIQRIFRKSPSRGAEALSGGGGIVWNGSRPLNLRHAQLNQSEAESSAPLSAGSVSARASAVRQQVAGGASASVTEATFSFYITPQRLLRTGPEPSGSSLLTQICRFSSYQLRFHVEAMHQVR
ncbi:hypothetical protein PDJAM_G00121820 [Pangasius djambal]|uniref:Uncharacterized protein n=1 Tax=Pangasius djambal TaxID=1691987 RepID=A0ACC5ZBP3_9TELE|nr:hypothetical protein [Pangasius djambal]